MTPAELLAATAADMRAVADAAATIPGATTFWARQSGKVAVGNHLAAWNPDMARAVADWLDDKAYLYAQPERVDLLNLDLKQGIKPPMLRVCAAWWKSRGREPVAP